MARQAPKGIVEPAITLPDVEAFVALQSGVASAAQQKRAIEWVMVEACRFLQDPFEEVRAAGSENFDHDIAFALGRRHIAVLMRRMLLPETQARAAALTKALHPEATRTTLSRKPKLSERWKEQRGDGT